MIKHHISLTDFCRTSWPLYKKRLTPLILWLANMINYQRKFLWSWLADLDILEKFKSGEEKLAATKLINLAQLIIKFDGVHEIYEETRKPVRRLIYRAEQPFAWGAGLFVYTCAKMGLIK